jgi:hypothetical protein
MESKNLNTSLFIVFTLVIWRVLYTTKYSLDYQYVINIYTQGVLLLFLSIYSFLKFGINKNLLPLIYISLIFFVTGQYSDGLSTFFLIFLAKPFGDLIFSDNKNKNIITIILIIITFLFLINTYLYSTFSSVYGRGQVLIGFIHPKEQALFFFFLFFVSTGLYQFNFKVLTVIILIGLYFTGSRNVFLSLIIFLFVLYSNNYFKILFSLFIFSILVLIFILFDNKFIYDNINLISSGRIDLWVKTYLGTKPDNFSIDSSIMHFARNGVFGLYLFIPFYLFLIFRIYIFHHKCQYFSRFTAAIGSSYLFFMIFDIGAFSVTNLFALIFWGFISTYEINLKNIK